MMMKMMTAPSWSSLQDQHLHFNPEVIRIPRIHPTSKQTWPRTTILFLPSWFSGKWPHRGDTFGPIFHVVHDHGRKSNLIYFYHPKSSCVFCFKLLDPAPCFSNIYKNTYLASFSIKIQHPETTWCWSWRCLSSPKRSNLRHEKRKKTAGYEIHESSWLFSDGILISWFIIIHV